MKKLTFSIDKRKTSKTQLIELCTVFRNRSAIALKLAGTGPNRNQVIAGGITMKKFHATYREAKKELARAKKTRANQDYQIYDLKKTFPRRVKTRYFIGNYFQWLNI